MASWLQQGHLVDAALRTRQGALDLQHDIRIANGGLLVGCDLGPGIGKGLVGIGSPQTGTGLDHHIGAERDQLLHRVRRDRDAQFMGAPFFGDANFHM